MSMVNLTNDVPIVNCTNPKGDKDAKAYIRWASVLLKQFPANIIITTPDNFFGI